MGVRINADICFVTAVRLFKVIEQLSMNGVQIAEGPGPQTGAAGAMMLRWN